MIWLLFVGIGLGTYATRLSFILYLGQVQIPALLLRILRFVPIAVLTAIIVPQLVLPQGFIDLTLKNPRWIAGALAAVIAWKTRNTFLTIVIGMVALWVLQALLT